MPLFVQPAERTHFQPCEAADCCPSFDGDRIAGRPSTRWWVDLWKRTIESIPHQRQINEWFKYWRNRPLDDGGPCSNGIMQSPCFDNINSKSLHGRRKSPSMQQRESGMEHISDTLAQKDEVQKMVRLYLDQMTTNCKSARGKTVVVITVNLGYLNSKLSPSFPLRILVLATPFPFSLAPHALPPPLHNTFEGEIETFEIQEEGDLSNRIILHGTCGLRMNIKALWGMKMTSLRN